MDNKVSCELAHDVKLQKRVRPSKLFKKIIEGCTNVIKEKGVHKDAKKLAKLVIIDCNKYLLGEK